MVITFEQAKRLAQLGVENHCEIYWKELHGEAFLTENPLRGEFGVYYHAYNSEELIGMCKGGYEICVYPDKSIGIAIMPTYRSLETQEKTLATILGDLLIYQLENGIVTAGKRWEKP